MRRRKFSNFTFRLEARDIKPAKCKMNKNQQEFIGKQITITKSKNNQQQNITGKIIDETKNTFTIRTQTQSDNKNQTKTIKILKSDKEFRIDNQKIDGNKITKRPEERIKIKEN